MKATTNKVILFDIYQTLIDIDVSAENKKRNNIRAWEKFAESLDKYSAHTTSSELLELSDRRKAIFYIGKDKNIRHHNFCEIMTKVLNDDLGLNIPQDKVCSLIYEYHKTARGFARLYPQVYETLAQLSEKYILLTASYTQRCFTQPELEELGIEKFFSHFVYTSDVGFHKQSPRFYQQCLEIVDKSANDCVMIGDNYDVDVLVPQNLGMKTIWVKNPITVNQYHDLVSKGPKGYIIDIEEFARLPEVVRKIFA